MKRRDQWLSEVKARQRNIVFPDTVRNEGEFDRNLVNQPLRNNWQKLGVVLVALLPLGFIAAMLAGLMSEAKNVSQTHPRLVGLGFFAGWLIATLGIIALLLVAVRAGVRRAERLSARKGRHA